MGSISIGNSTKVKRVSYSLCGNVGVGKQGILKNYAGTNLTTVSEIGGCYITKNVQLEDFKFELMIWSSIDSVDKVRNAFFTYPLAICFVYNSLYLTSFTDLKAWIDRCTQARSNISSKLLLTSVLVGNSTGGISAVEDQDIENMMRYISDTLGLDLQKVYYKEIKEDSKADIEALFQGINETVLDQILQMS